MNVHDCVAAVVQHFYAADYLRLKYTLPIEAYALNRTLQYRICNAWDRFQRAGLKLSERECVLLAECWIMSAPDHTKPMFVYSAWKPSCANCKEQMQFHRHHPENNPKGDPPDRWLCEDGKLYTPIVYPEPQFGGHPTDIEVNRR